MRRYGIGAGLLLAAIVTFGANAGDVDSGRELIDRFVANVVTLQANFKQVLIDADGQVVETTTGTLEIQRPGRFRWTYVEPYRQTLVADGMNVWSYDVDLEQVTVKPQARALANTPALLLGGSDDALDQFAYEESYFEDNLNWVSLRPTNTDSGFTSVELGFDGDTLMSMVFQDNLKQTTLVTLSGVTVNEPIDAKCFRFEVPDGVDLVGTPAVAEATGS